MNTQWKKSMKHTRIILLIALLGLAAAGLPSLRAATITVTEVGDGLDVHTNLRQALTDAQDGDVIEFAPELGGYTLALIQGLGELVVNKSVTIRWVPTAGYNSYLGVSSWHLSRVFYISPGKTVTISGLNILNGSAPPPNYWGGAIYNDHASLTLNNCTISGNSAGDNGGGIYNYGGSMNATLKVLNSTLSGNSAHFYGGGIFNISAYGGSAPADVLNCTLSGNSAGRFGGGIYNNAAVDGSSPLEVLHSTFSDNSAFQGPSGGIANFSATLQLGSTILNASSISNSSGTITSLGYNLSSDNGGGFLAATGDQINTTPMLGPLQDNGGPTYTHALLTGSPAIDAGDPNFDPNAFNPPMLYDQRGSGYSRVAHGRIDIGAFEIVVPSYAGQIQPPINADGSSNFNVRRGVVPVRFNLTLGGVATCDLPPATIAVTRTAGGVIGEVNESVYGGNADTGSNFRIDSCQYIYNLNSRALGAGTYRVDILIDGQVVGSAVFALN